MARIRLSLVAVVSLGCLLTALAGLTGCGQGTLTNGPNENAVQVKGQAFGGQQPISGATVQVYAAGSTGYGSAASPLLSPALTTDANGNFAYSGSFTCPTPTTPVYLTVTQGNPGLTTGTNNTGIALMAALGPCSLLSGPLKVLVNELTTVASRSKVGV